AYRRSYTPHGYPDWPRTGLACSDRSGLDTSGRGQRRTMAASTCHTNETVRSRMLEIDEQSLKHGVLTLVVTLVEVIQEARETRALRSLEGGDLTEKEQDRLGEALKELDEAMDDINDHHGITASVTDLTRGVEDVVDEVVEPLI